MNTQDQNSSEIPSPSFSPPSSRSNLFVTVLVGLIMLFIGLGAGYLLFGNKTANSGTQQGTRVFPTSTKELMPTVSQTAVSPSGRVNLTQVQLDQIFTEVSTQFHLTKNQLAQFRIFGPDKVQYTLNLPSAGVTLVYKQGGIWHIAVDGAQNVGECSDSYLADIPEQYRPPCYDATHAMKYPDNYPDSQSISYIGQ